MAAAGPGEDFEEGKVLISAEQRKGRMGLKIGRDRKIGVVADCGSEIAYPLDGGKLII